MTDVQAGATPRLSVVVPMYNETRRMRRTLPMLADYFRGQNYSVEFVVVDDGSSDSTQKWHASFWVAGPT